MHLKLFKKIELFKCDVCDIVGVHWVVALGEYANFGDSFLCCGFVFCSQPGRRIVFLMARVSYMVP